MSILEREYGPDGWQTRAPAVQWRGLSFVETPGAGEYVGSILVPAGAYLMHLVTATAAAWDADTASVVVAPAFIDYIELGTVKTPGDHGYVCVWGYDISPRGVLVDTEFVFTLTTTGAGGDSGRTSLWLAFGISGTLAVKQ